MTEQSPIAFSCLVSAITQQIEQARGQVRQAVNTAMVQSYWEMGRLIVEHEQQGNRRAEYGKQQLQQLSQQLTERLGKGFNVTNLRNMRQFYQAFPIRETVSLKLSWSHYNLLSKVENPSARKWYQQEAEQHSWSVRALERQINTLYYERLPGQPRQIPGGSRSSTKHPAVGEARQRARPTIKKLEFRRAKTVSPTAVAMAKPRRSQASMRTDPTSSTLFTIRDAPCLELNLR
ncbi:hypothetical protein HORIV_72470 [Vreelandella olivaria]|uniref:YhcG N-terminal domain-containing protein n=1 Tax=Vreelandella olivaria TaxID=390919 RepID=A0ABN5XE90_9GAMM|nr:hypothetical protein HORIV_72470 [Halomonas olivaria]